LNQAGATIVLSTANNSLKTTLAALATAQAQNQQGLDSAKASLDQSLNGVLTAPDTVANDQVKQQASIQTAQNSVDQAQQALSKSRATLQNTIAQHSATLQSAQNTVSQNQSALQTPRANDDLDLMAQGVQQGAPLGPVASSGALGGQREIHLRQSPHGQARVPAAREERVLSAHPLVRPEPIRIQQLRSDQVAQSCH
jgi:hypothetical protein